MAEVGLSLKSSTENTASIDRLTRQLLSEIVVLRLVTVRRADAVAPAGARSATGSTSSARISSGTTAVR
jgi:hypothetical protein